MTFRIGQGFDTHRFTKGKPLILGGIQVPYKFGLAGHSDADVLTHAIIDAVLGALSLGDIGKWFSDTNPKYKNINSMKLLEYVLQSKQLTNWSLVNLDTTIITQEPKLSQYTQPIQQNLAQSFNAKADQISIKSKTTEGMRFCGSTEGIVALANLLIKFQIPNC